MGSMGQDSGCCGLGALCLASCVLPAVDSYYTTVWNPSACSMIGCPLKSARSYSKTICSDFKFIDTGACISGICPIFPASISSTSSHLFHLISLTCHIHVTFPDLFAVTGSGSGCFSPRSSWQSIGQSLQSLIEPPEPPEIDIFENSLPILLCVCIYLYIYINCMPEV